MCWQPMMNCEHQSIAMTLYHRVALIVSSFTYLALLLFSTVSAPALSIHMVKYSQRKMTTAKHRKVWKNAQSTPINRSTLLCVIFTRFTKRGSNKSSGMLVATLPASLNSWITSRIRFLRMHSRWISVQVAATELSVYLRAIINTQITMVTIVERIEKPSRILRRRSSMTDSELVRTWTEYCCHMRMVAAVQTTTTLINTIHTINFAAYLNSNIMTTDEATSVFGLNAHLPSPRA